MEGTDNTKLSDLADVYIAWKLEKENSEERTKKANENMRAAEQAIYEKMQAEEIDKFAHDGNLFFPRVESHASVNKELEDQFCSWLDEHNEGGIAKRTVHPQTLRAWYRQNADRFAEELSEKNFLKVYEEIRISVRKA